MTQTVTSKPKKKPIPCIKCRRPALKITVGGVDPMCKKHYGEKLVEQKREEVKREGPGRRGPYIPLSIIEMYEEAIVDEQLVALREDIATTDARAKQLLKQIRESPHDNLSFIEVLKNNLDQNLASVKRGGTTYPELVHNLKTLLDEKVSEKILWAEFYKVTELKRRLVVAESKRLAELGWTPETVFAMIGEISNILKPLLPDDKLVMFFRSLADNPLFNNQQFKFLPAADLSVLELPSRLNAELDRQAIEVKKQQDGAYAVEGEIDNAPITVGECSGTGETDVRGSIPGRAAPGEDPGL